MTKLPTIQAGDIIEIIAPSKSPPKASIKAAEKLITSWGLTPQIAQNITGKDVMFNNNDHDRLTQLTEALHNPHSKVIWCIKGGYGNIRLMPELYKIPPPKTPKLLIGFSDTTALHIWANQHLGWPSLHAPVLEQVALGYNTKATIQKLKDVLYGNISELSYSPLTPTNSASKETAQITATLIGGNASLIHTSIGTEWQLNTDNKILFLEDVDERGYRIDAMLQHYQQSGLLKKPKAIILGDFTGGSEPNGSSEIKNVLNSFAQSVSYPVYRYKKIGHNKNNTPLPLGIPYTIVQKGPAITMICTL